MFHVGLPRNAAEQKTAGTTATVRIYGPIDSWGGFWGVSAKDVSDALDGLDDSVDTIQVRLNSPGGEAFEGVAIMNMLRAHKARTIAVVDGLAASAASVIAVGCDETVMSPGSELMIHEASAGAYGDADEMDKARRMLDSVSDTLASVYAEKAGGSTEEWRAAMHAESWYTAAEAVAAGLADRTATVPDAGPTGTAGADEEAVLPSDGEVEDLFDLSIFTYAGRSHAPAPNPPNAIAAVGSHQRGAGVVDFNDQQIAALRQQVGLAEDADPDTIVAAVKEALSERAEPQPTNAVPAGHRLIPEAAFEDLQRNAQRGAEAAEQLRIQDRNRFLDDHRDRFAPESRAAWERQYDVDPEGTKAYLENAAVIVPLNEVGHAKAADSVADDEDQLYASVYGDEKKGA
jgi:ATP-dependent protease ClpP protease subunit